MKNGLLVSDADNTLWDTNSVFADAQRAILVQVEDLVGASADCQDRLAFVRQFDQDIARRHEAGLKYPPHLLVEALVKGIGAKPISDKKVEDIVAAYCDFLAQKPRLRLGVRPTLKLLKDSNVKVIIASEGGKDRLRDNLSAHKLDSLITDIVVAKKSRELFDGIYRSSGTVFPKVCVGDQLDRDITPAKQAGFTTLYFPGGFRPSWEFDMAAKDADRVIKSYADVKDAFELRNAA